MRRFIPITALRHWTTRSKLIAGFLAVSLIGTVIGTVAIFKSSPIHLYF